MLVHTKKPRIKARGRTAKHPVAAKMNSEKILILVTCPIENADQIKQYLGEKGCVSVDAGQEWIDAKGLFADRTPANMLIGARGKESITQMQLSKVTGIPRRHISDMENGRRPIGKQNALKLGKALNISYRIFL